MIDKAKKYGISITTVAIGFGSHGINSALASSMAKQTGGKFYSTKDYKELPRIFMKEAQLVRRSLIQETPFTPSVVNTLATTIEGLRDGGVPQLGGYVLTSGKPLAQIPARPCDRGRTRSDPRTLAGRPGQVRRLHKRHVEPLG